MIFVQTRSRSKRLPFKALLEIDGIPLVERVVESCLRNKSGHGVVLLLPESDFEGQVHRLARSRFGSEIEIFFGSEENVFSRFRNAYLVMENELRSEHPELGLVRVCGDRPLLQPELIDVLDHSLFDEELLFNHVPPPGFHGPVGLGAESMHRDLAERYFRGADFLPRSEEHVTLSLYSTREVRTRYVVPEWVSRVPPEIKYDLDTAEDFRDMNSRAAKLREAHPFGLYLRR